MSRFFSLQLVINCQRDFRTNKKRKKIVHSVLPGIVLIILLSTVYYLGKNTDLINIHRCFKIRHTRGCERNVLFSSLKSAEQHSEVRILFLCCPYCSFLCSQSYHVTIFFRSRTLSRSCSIIHHSSMQRELVILRTS